MHGRLKVRTTEEQRFQKEKEHKRKLQAYRDGMDKILSSRNENTFDESSLSLSGQILCSNPDIYTLWNYRKEVVLIVIRDSKKNDLEGEEELIKFLENELKLTKQSLISNPKSYGSWHHRYWILLNHPKPNWQNEFDLCNQYFSMDDRNFHCWDFRRLIINKIGLTLTDELAFSTERLNANFSNYSSWHYRSTLRELDEHSIEIELKLVENAIFTDPNDSSAWFYLRWVLSTPSIPKKIKENLMESLSQLQEMEPDCKWIILAKCWLSGSLFLGDANFLDKRIEFYKQLIKLDILRKGQYMDYIKDK